MNRKMKKIIAVSIVLMMSWVFTGTAGAWPSCRMASESGGGCRGMGFEGNEAGTGSCMAGAYGGIRVKKLMALDLTDAQKTRIANILAAQRDESRKLADDLSAARKDLFALLHSENAGDEAAVREKYRKISGIMENQVVLKAKLQTELKPILNPEQIMALLDRSMENACSEKQGKCMKKDKDLHREMMDMFIRAYGDAPEANK